MTFSKNTTTTFSLFEKQLRNEKTNARGVIVVDIIGPKS